MGATQTTRSRGERYPSLWGSATQTPLKDASLRVEYDNGKIVDKSVIDHETLEENVNDVLKKNLNEDKDKEKEGEANMQVPSKDSASYYEKDEEQEGSIELSDDEDEESEELSGIEYLYEEDADAFVEEEEYEDSSDLEVDSEEMMEFAQEHFNDEYHEREDSEEPDSELISDMIDVKAREDCEEFQQMRKCEEEYDASCPRTRVVPDWIVEQEANLPEDSQFRTRETIHDYEAENEMRRKHEQELLKNSDVCEDNTSKNAKMCAEDLQRETVTISKRSKPKRRVGFAEDVAVVHEIEESPAFTSHRLKTEQSNNECRIGTLNNELRRADSDDQEEKLRKKIEILESTNCELQRQIDALQEY